MKEGLAEIKIKHILQKKVLYIYEIPKNALCEHLKEKVYKQAKQLYCILTGQK